MGPEELTEDQVDQYLDWALANVRKAVEQLADERLWDVLPGSSLLGDDRKTDPYHVSHQVRSLIGSATDHMHAVSNLVGRTRALHPMAPFTLTRGAIETASTAVWLLQPSSRLERVTRRMRLAIADTKDGYTASEELGLPRARTKEEQLERLGDIARRAGVATDALRAKFSSTEAVTAAGSVVETSFHVLTAWRICSGFAHGRLWAILSTLDREHVRDFADGAVLLRLTNDKARVAWAIGTALDVTRFAGDLYQRRAHRS